MTFFRLCRNEYVKLLRHRWWLLAIVVALLILIMNYPILQSLAVNHRLPSFGQKVEWRQATQQGLSGAESQVKNLSQYRETLVSRTHGANAPAGFVHQIDDQIAAAQRRADTFRLELDRNTPPVEFEPIIGGFMLVLSVMGFIFVILLSWLGSESIAGERSSRTLGLLLARPVTRGGLLGAKAVTVGSVALALLLFTLVLTGAYTQLYVGQLGDLGSSAAIVRDSTAAASVGNLLLLPLPVVLLLALGGTLIGLACSGAMALAISAFAGRTGAAVGITLGIIFGGPVVASAINGIMSISSGKPADWLDYLWFQNFLPVGKLGAFFGSSGVQATGSDPFFKSLAIESGWAVAFVLLAYLFMRRVRKTD